MMLSFIKDLFRKNCIGAATKRSRLKTVTAHNFDTARKVGVISPFLADMNKIAAMLKTIAGKYKLQLHTVIYFDDKLEMNVLSTQYEIWFSDKACNWFGKPKMTDINNFIDARFDILVDLSTKTYFPLQYISIKSKADFKIGRINDASVPYDLVITGCDTEKCFMDKLEYYLNKINTDK